MGNELKEQIKRLRRNKRKEESGEIIKNEEVFKTNYVPNKIKHRGDELASLADYFNPILDEENPQDLTIKGGTGTGKTAVIRYALNGIKDLIGESNLNIKKTYVSCQEYSTTTQVFSKIARTITDKELSQSGHSYSFYIEEIKEYLKKEDMKLIIVLDEVDMISSDSRSDHLNTVLYNFTNNTDITTITISNRADWTDELEARVTSRMGERKLRFEPYTKDQLFSILKDRAEVGLVDGSYNDEVIEKIADIGSSNFGDARMAVKLLYESAKQAIEEISKIDVQEAADKIEGDSVLEYARGMTSQKKMILYALSKVVKRKVSNKAKYEDKEDDGLYAKTSEIYSEYKNLINKNNLDLRILGRNMVYKHLNDLHTFGIIEKEKNYKGNHGRGENIHVPKCNPEKFINFMEGNE